MKKSLFVSAVTALTIVVGLVAVAQAQKDKQVIYVSPAQATYKATPMGGVSMAALWVRWTRALMQHSPNSTPDTTRECARRRDVWIVIKGAYLYI